MKNIVTAMNRDWADEWLRLQVGVQSHWPTLSRRMPGRRRAKGATLVEYGIMVALIAAVVVATVGVLGDEVLGAFETIVTGLGGTLPQE